MKTRIVELPEGYIVQVKEYLFGRWKGIDSDSFKSFGPWNLPEYQIKHCLCRSKQNAEELEKKYQLYRESLRRLK